MQRLNQSPLHESKNWCSITCAFVLKLLALHNQTAQVCQLEPGFLVEQMQQQCCTPQQPVPKAAQLHRARLLSPTMLGVSLGLCLHGGATRIG